MGRHSADGNAVPKTWPAPRLCSLTIRCAGGPPPTRTTRTTSRAGAAATSGSTTQGNLIVQPRGEGNGAIDMKELIDELVARGIQLPILLRFSDILRARIELLCGAFNGAIREYGYGGQYRGVYPIKVNQNRTVVEEIIEFGRPFHYGLEAGSKPELLAIMAIHQDDEALIICNGYKDEEYIETALLASKMGKTVILVVEKPTELDNIHRVSERVKIKPSLGIRARLSSRGAGRWEQSGGDFSKFGLSAAEMVDAIAKLKAWGETDTLKLLHFHLGSQISRDQEREERAARGRPAVRRAVQDGREGPVVPRRRRRPRRRLRRLADQLRVVDELHGAGVRERRRLRDQGDLRRRSGPAPEHRQRVRPRDRRAPLGARRQRARRDRVQHARPAAAREAGAAARHQHVGDVPEASRRRTCSRAITTPSSTRIRSSSCSTSGTSRSSTACCAKTCSGRSARRC